MDRRGALALAQGARRFLIKAGQDTLRFDAASHPLDEEQALRYLVHEDGLMRVPVLLWGDLLVRGYTEDLYREVFDAMAGREAMPGKGETR